MEYFAKISEPRKLRLSMMTCAKESIIMISLLEEIEAIRQKKTELFDETREDLRACSELMTRMNEFIGDEKTRMEVLNSYTASEKSEPHKTAKPQAKVSESKNSAASYDGIKEKTEVDRLEYTLRQIEERIAKLSK